MKFPPHQSRALNSDIHRISDPKGRARNRINATSPLPLMALVSSSSPQKGNTPLQRPSSDFRYWQGVSKVFAALSDHPSLLNNSSKVQLQTTEEQQKRLCPSAVISRSTMSLKDCDNHEQIPFLFTADLKTFLWKSPICFHKLNLHCSLKI